MGARTPILHCMCDKHIRSVHTYAVKVDETDLGKLRMKGVPSYLVTTYFQKHICFQCTAAYSVALSPAACSTAEGRAGSHVWRWGLTPNARSDLQWTSSLLTMKPRSAFFWTYLSSFCWALYQGPRACRAGRCTRNLVINFTSCCSTIKSHLLQHCFKRLWYKTNNPDAPGRESVQRWPNSNEFVKRKAISTCWSNQPVLLTFLTSKTHWTACASQLLQSANSSCTGYCHGEQLLGIAQ